MKKKLIMLLLTIALFMGVSTNAKALNTPTPVFGGRLIWNIESIYYYVSPSAEQYAGYIGDAAYNWVYTGLGWNDLYPNVRTSNIVYSAVDFFSATSHPDGALAETKSFARTNGTWGDAYRVYPYFYPDTTNWLYSEIWIYSDDFNDLGNYDRRGTISHEFGHVWGLGHNQLNPNSIMCQLGYGRVVNTVQQVDQDAFNSKY